MARPGWVFDPFNGCCGTDDPVGTTCNLRKTSGTTAYQQWARKVDETVTHVAVLSTGDVILGCATGGTAQLYRIRTSDGTTRWKKDLSASVVDLYVDASDGIYVTTSSTLLKYTAGGSRTYSVTGQHPSGDAAKYITVSGSTIYVAGTTKVWSLDATTGESATSILTATIRGGANAFTSISFDGTDILLANGNYVDRVTTAGVHSWGYDHTASVRKVLCSGTDTYYCGTQAAGVSARKLDAAGASLWAFSQSVHDLTVDPSGTPWSVNTSDGVIPGAEAPTDSNYINGSSTSITKYDASTGATVWQGGGSVSGSPGTSTNRIAANSSDVFTNCACFVCAEFLPKTMNVVMSVPLHATGCTDGGGNDLCDTNNPISFTVTWTGSYWESGTVSMCDTLSGKLRITYSTPFVSGMTIRYSCTGAGAGPTSGICLSGYSNTPYLGEDLPMPVNQTLSFSRSFLCNLCATAGVTLVITD